jgi:hypothetical protein
MQITIKANPDLKTDAEAWEYIDDLIAETPDLSPYRGALYDLVKVREDFAIELHEDTDVRPDGYLDTMNGVRCLWIPATGRAALNCYQAGDWAWTDADSAEDAIRRYREDDMCN